MYLQNMGRREVPKLSGRITMLESFLGEISLWLSLAGSDYDKIVLTYSLTYSLLLYIYSHLFTNLSTHTYTR